MEGKVCESEKSGMNYELLTFVTLLTSGLVLGTSLSMRSLGPYVRVCTFICMYVTFYV